MNEPQRITKDAKIDCRVPQITKDQLEQLAAEKYISPATYLQLLIDDTFKKRSA